MLWWNRTPKLLKYNYPVAWNLTKLSPFTKLSKCWSIHLSWRNYGSHIALKRYMDRSTTHFCCSTHQMLRDKLHKGCRFVIKGNHHNVHCLKIHALPWSDVLMNWTQLASPQIATPKCKVAPNGFHGILSCIKSKKSIQPTNHHTADQSICLPKTIQIMFSEKDKLNWWAVLLKKTLNTISTWAAPDVENQFHKPWNMLPRHPC